LAFQNVTIQNLRADAGGTYSGRSKNPFERQVMNPNIALDKARKELEKTKAQALGDEKLAHQARQTAKAAKLKLKQVRRLSKFTKKAARLAEDKADKSKEALDIALAKVEKLERRMRKRQKKAAAKNKPAKPAREVKPVTKAKNKPKTAVRRPAKKISRPASRRRMSPDISDTTTGTPAPAPFVAAGNTAGDAAPIPATDPQADANPSGGN